MSVTRFDEAQARELVVPSFRATPLSPAIPRDRGIAIAAPERVSNGGRFPVVGSFSLERARLTRFAGPPHAAVVLLLRGPSPAVVNIALGRLFYKDDVLEDDEYVHGHFNIDLFEDLGLVREPNVYWLSASAFDRVSDVATIEVV